MTVFDHFDQMARGGAMSLLILWSWLLWRDHGGVLAARLAILLNICTCCYLLVTAGWAERSSPYQLVLALGAGATPGLFWLFARAWFNDESRVSPIGVALVIVAVANTLFIQLTFDTKPPAFFVSAVLFRVSMFGFGIAGLWEVWRGRDGDLIESRRRLRPRIVGTVGGYVVLIAIAEMIVFNDLGPRWITSLVASSIVFITLAFCGAMFAMRSTDLFGAATTKAKTAVTDNADDPLIRRLIAHMASELPHRDETLTIARLASQLGEPEYRMRRVINQAMGHRNFAQFLNGYRLAEVKAALSDPAQRDVPIITIALDAGFGSLGPFNRAFREAEGMTPSEFRAIKAG